MISLNSNIASLFGANSYNSVTASIDKVSKQLATGKRIISAADDPAGVGILSTLKSQDSSYDAVQKNLTAGKALLGVATTSLKTQQELLTQMSDIATQASSELLTGDQRDALKSQFGELQHQLDIAVTRATIFGKNLTSDTGADVVIQSGIENGDSFTLKAVKSDATTLGVDSSSVDLNDANNSKLAMTALKTAIGTVASSQSLIGTQETGLEKLAGIARDTQLNIKSSISNIEDVDVAALSSQLTQLQAKQSIQLQMLNITNSMPSQLLSLLR